MIKSKKCQTSFCIFVQIFFMSVFFNLGEDVLSIQKCFDIIKGETKITISEEVKKTINKSAENVAKIVESERIVYGINTGFGPLCNVKISVKETNKLQENILKSHAVGVGNPIEDDLVRLMMITKLQALSKGFSGVQLSTLERILFFLEQDVLPQVPEQGSVGASGDLAPLSHLFLPLIGEGNVKYRNEVISAQEMHQKLSISPIKLGAKEGLALINGTQFILAHAVLGAYKMKSALEHADILGAVMVEALNGSTRPFMSELHKIRPFKGTQEVAENLIEYTKNSAIFNAHKGNKRVQDPYSLRCMPQVHGASRNALYHLIELIEIELNSVTDNPIVVSESEAISGGNFHGQPLAMVLDYATLASAEIGNIADRRIYLSLEGEKIGLPKLLMKETGLNSGFMIWQYTSAALVTENKTLCFPASADSIPTSMGQEDHVSMGSISGRKLLKVLHNIDKIQAIELITACQALEFNRPLKSSEFIEQVLGVVRKEVPFFDKDEYFAPYIEKGISIIKSQELISLKNEMF